MPTCKSSLSVCLSFSRYSSNPNFVNSYWRCTLKFISSTECTTIFTNCIQATMNSIWKLSYWVKYAISVVNLRLSEQTSLKLSNADRIISWPPFTRQIAASSSNTRALVLQRQINKNKITHNCCNSMLNVWVFDNNRIQIHKIILKIIFHDLIKQNIISYWIWCEMMLNCQLFKNGRNESLV